MDKPVALGQQRKWWIIFKSTRLGLRPNDKTNWTHSPLLSAAQQRNRALLENVSVIYLCIILDPFSLSLSTHHHTANSCTCTCTLGTYRGEQVQTKVFWANFEGSYLNEFDSVDLLRWKVVQSPLENMWVVWWPLIRKHRARKSKIGDKSAKKSALVKNRFSSISRKSV